MLLLTNCASYIDVQRIANSSVKSAARVQTTVGPIDETAELYRPKPGIRKPPLCSRNRCNESTMVSAKHATPVTNMYIQNLDGVTYIRYDLALLLRPLSNDLGIVHVVPATQRSTLGDRAFAVAGPHARNSLPHFVTDCTSSSTFRKHHKTFYSTGHSTVCGKKSIP